MAASILTLVALIAMTVGALSDELAARAPAPHRARLRARSRFWWTGAGVLFVASFLP